ncbi:MAG: hypothetical protein ACJ8FK_08240 [Xanthobacteraceae bacterium]
MTGSRLLAIFLAACALAASALIALPLDGAEAPSATVALPEPRPDRFYDLSARPSQPTTESNDETHAALPRLWLGSPVAR